MLERADSEDLWALANAARYVGRYPLARQALSAQRRRFPSSDRARQAAFLLGRLHDADPDGPGNALGWYDRYLVEARDGADVSDALGRKMTLLQRWNRRTEALAVARDYLRRFPRGTYANAARALVRSSISGTVNQPPRRLFGRLHRTGVVLLLLMLDGSGASAESTQGAETVILLQPTTASLAVRRSLARIRDELSADRFHVIVADSSTPGDPGAVIDNAARDTEGGTVLALFGDPETGQAELCVVQRAARRAAVRRATVVVDDPERMPEALATRALELLRATALELSIEIERAPRSPKAARAASRSWHRTERRPRPRRRRRLPSSRSTRASEYGTASRDRRLPWRPSVESACVCPSGSGRASASPGWEVVPASRSAYGSAALSQTMALAEFAAVFRRDKRIRPTLSLGAGVLNVAVVGTGAAPYEGREPQRWSAAFDGGVGVAFAVGSRAALVTELHALVATPHPVVRFADTRAATIGYPSLILTLALQVAL